MRHPVVQAVIFFSCLAAFGIAFGIHALAAGTTVTDTIRGVASLGAGISAIWLAVKAARFMRIGPPPPDD